MLEKEVKPVHPGAILEEMIESLRKKTGQALTVNEIAKGLGVHRVTLSAVLNQRTGVSPEMAVKLSEAFNTNADFWINIQKNHDLWKAETKVDRSRIHHFTSISD